MEGVNKKAAGVTMLLVIVGIFLGFTMWDSPETVSSDDRFIEVPAELEFKVATVTVTGIETSSEKQTIHFKIKNNSSQAINVSDFDFTIENDGKVFQPDLLSAGYENINPDMEVETQITFEMNEESLTNGIPILAVERGIFSTERQELKLLN